MKRKRIETDANASFESLVARWNDLGQSHFDGPELDALATQIVGATRDAEKLAQLPYAVGNWNGSWRQVGKHAAAACEKIARAALAIDPSNEAALWLYAQEDFLWSVNRWRKKGERLTGAPVPKLSTQKAVAKIERILEMFVRGTHPLSIPSLDTIAVDSPEIVDALIAGIDCKEWRGGLRCIEALGRAEVELPRVLDVFMDVLAKGDSRFVDQVAMAANYGLKAKGGPLMLPLLRSAESILRDLRRDDSGDYRHQWPLRAAMRMAPHADKEARAQMRSWLERLVHDFPAMEPWKQERLFEANMDAPELLVTLRKLAGTFDA